MQYAERAIVGMVKAYAARHGLEVEIGLDGWLITIGKGTARHYIYGYDFGLNNSVAHRIANDKSATASVLAGAGVACVPHALFMNHNLFKVVVREANWPRLLDLLAAHPNGLVVKPNEGTCGNLVFKVGDAIELEQAAMAIFAAGQNVAAAPYLTIERELRVVLLDGRPLAVYDKKRPQICGDGVRTAMTLLVEALPPERLGATLAQLRSSSVRLDEVLPEGETLRLDWRHNLDLGAVPELVGDGPLREESVAIAARAAAAVGLVFGAVDVVWSGAVPQVLEINSGVMVESLSKYYPELAQRIYVEALDFIRQRITPGATEVRR
ncbi:RimK family alpha-L-glutamate ligase [Rhodopseudomonas sp. B29]|uniref:ATP-grasp domain-containing protein n=1 Tax=Rhodopseudomonas sp. B29 TaxID=95607 RepID=UPI0003498C99|nr:hypothetical protein [Rhodopseudomonas sp. B29]